MYVDGSPEPVPGTSPAKSWMENLRGGLYLALFLHPARFRFHVSPNHFVAIAATSLAVSAGCSFVLAGSGGLFNLQALPSELLWVPLALLAGRMVARVMGEERLALLVAIAAGSIGIVFSVVSSVLWFASVRSWLRLSPVSGLFGIYQLLFAWWALATLLAITRFTSTPRRTILPGLIVAIVFLLPLYFLPAEPLWEEVPDGEDASASRQQPFNESALYAQQALLRAAEQRLKPERAGVEDLYFVGFAPYAAQDVFMKETLAIGKLLEERFDVGGREINLISHARVIDQFPIATLTSLRRALGAVGRRINPEEDVVLLHLTSHGSQNHELSVEFYPLQLQAIRPADVRAALDDAGIKWRIVVVSACYSGGFIDALKDTHALVIAASDANHTSFGCGDAFDFTYFSQAYYDGALRGTYSFEQAFGIARQAIAAREGKEGLEPSNPQISVGKAMRTKLAHLEKRLSGDTANAK